LKRKWRTPEKKKHDFGDFATFTSLQKGGIGYYSNTILAEMWELLFPAQEGGNYLSKAG
jgi:hypothetical protein